MSDISNIVRTYYDNAVDPVTASEILSAPPIVDRSGHRRPFGFPNWAIAAAVAVAVVAVIGAASLLLGGSDGSSIPVAPTGTTTVTEPAGPESATGEGTPAGETEVATTVAEQDAPSTEQEGVWMNNRWGVLLSVTPPLLPPVHGSYEVTVHGFVSGYQERVWVTSCPGARGVVNADAWQPAEEPGALHSMCAFSEDHHVPTGDFVDGVFETIVRVEIDDAAIRDGGIVITAGDIWVPVAGNVLLRIGDDPQTPWEQAHDALDITGLTQLISYWPPFVSNFNTAYAALGNCQDAYSAAVEGQRAYLDALATWDDTQRDKPGFEYDKAVTRLIASERWLHDHTCAGRGDFVSVG